MELNIKSARDYSSKLKNVIEEIKNSLRVTGALVNNFDRDTNINSVPATVNGIYKATITHKKSSLNEVIGKNLEDEIITVEAQNDLAKISPDTRLTMLNDLMKERMKVDFLIETIKNQSTIKDSFSGENITYDFGCQVNNAYREYNEYVLKPLLNANKELNTVVNGKMTNISNSDERTSVTVAYPIEIKATLNINTDILTKYEEIDNKIRENSAKLSSVEISKFFNFEPKFSLNPSVKGLIAKYEDK